MLRFRSLGVIAGLLTVAATLSACGSSTPASTPTLAPASTTSSASATTALTKTVSSTVVSTAATSLPAATATKAAATGAVSASDLVARARATSEFAFDFKTTSAGQVITGTMHIKGTKLRMEGTVQGQTAVIISDSATKISYLLMAGQNAAMKMDMSQVASQAPNPTDQVGQIPADAKLIGNDTVDGKPAVVYESTTTSTTTPSGQVTTRYALWTERGLPLRIETTTTTGKQTMEFLNYQFTAQPDSLFQLPQGTNVIELPSVPSGLGGLIPTP